MTKKQEFINCLVNLKNKGLTSGFDLHAVYSQATLETGHIKEDDILVQHHNLFGMKSHNDWKGEDVEVPTTEVVNGKLVNIKDWFIAFPDFYQMIEFYKTKIQHMYPNAYEGRSNYKDYFNGLMNGKYHWSTSPNYSDTLIKLYERLRAEGDCV